MKIELWVKDFGSISDLDISYWKSEHLPLVGDFIDYCNEEQDLEFSGEVIKRTFVFRTDKVWLDIEVSKETYTEISNYFKNKISNYFKNKTMRNYE